MAAWSSPNDPATPVLWIDAQDASMWTLSGDTITAWSNKGSEAAGETVGGSPTRESVGGLVAVNGLDGSNYLEQAGVGGSFGGAATVVAAYYPLQTGISYLFDAGEAADAAETARLYRDSANLTASMTDTGASANAQDSGDNASGWNVCAWRVPAAVDRVELWLNEGAKVEHAVASLAWANGDQFAIGTVPPGGSGGLIAIGELVVYGSDLSDAEVANGLLYLAARWQVTPPTISKVPNVRRFDASMQEGYSEPYFRRF